MKKWRQKNSKIILDDKYMKVRKDLLQLPDGREMEWTYWDSTDSVMILGMTANNKLLMVKQYKYLVGDDILEFPAGRLNPGEKLEAGAKREFEEETGYKAKKLVKLGSFYETYSQLNRQIHIYFANNVTKSIQNPDKGNQGFEDLKILLVDFEKAVNLARKNKIVAMGCSLAILLLKEKIATSEISLQGTVPCKISNP